MYKNYTYYYFLPQLVDNAQAFPWFKRTTLPEIDGTGAEAVERLEDYWHLVESAACLSVLQERSESSVLKLDLFDHFSPDGRRWESASLKDVASEIVNYTRHRLFSLGGPVSIENDYLTEVPPGYWFSSASASGGDSDGINHGKIDYKMDRFRPVVNSDRYTFGEVLKTDDLRVLFYDMGKLSRHIFRTDVDLRRYEDLIDENVTGTHILGPVIVGDKNTFDFVRVYSYEGETETTVEKQTVGLNSPFSETGMSIFEGGYSHGYQYTYHPPMKLAWLVPRWWVRAISNWPAKFIKDAVVLVVVSCSVGNNEDNKSGSYEFLYPIRAEVGSPPDPFVGGVTDKRWVVCEYDDQQIFNFAESMINERKPGYFDRNKKGYLHVSKRAFLDLSMTVKWELPTTWGWTPD